MIFFWEPSVLEAVLGAGSPRHQAGSVGQSCEWIGSGRVDMQS